jgi:TolA-binding protein
MRELACGWGYRLSVLAITTLALACLITSVWAQAAGGEKNPASAPYESALKAYRAGDYKKAAGILEQYVSQKPAAEAYYLLGYADYKLRKNRAASECFKQAYLIDPELKPESIFLKK